MNRATILCIDDELLILHSLRDQLAQSLGDEFSVEMAESGFEALELLSELSAENVDVPLVICDQLMPGIPGDRVLEKIHRLYPKTRKILLTGKASSESIISAVNHANLYRYISKPWDETDLNLAIREAVRSYYQDKRLSEQNLTLKAINQKLEQEIIERKQAELKLRHLALHDPLTGLPNRKFFIEQIDGILQSAKQDSSIRFAVLFIDLDRFKVINDSLGHDVGDQLLIEIADRLKRCVRVEDVVARLGGDEFTILLNPVQNLYDATEIAERILCDLSMPFDLKGQKFGTNASIGIIEGSGEYENSISLLRDADTAMYSAKNNGKARYAVFHRGMHVQTLNIWHLESALQQALERNELTLNYQPVISLKTGKTKGLEALLRWHHTERGLISPEEFIPIAEDSGLILVIGEWVLQEACRQLKEWHDCFPQYNFLSVSVNIASKQLHETHFVEIVDRILAETGLGGSSLILELTESALIEDTETTIHTLHQLCDRGIHLSLDDFGRGYSSLSYLNQIPIASLKIDRSFTSQIDAGQEKSLNIMRGITSLAHSLGLKVVVEGIETAEQMQQVTQLNCELGQGYYFSPPLPQQGMEQWLQNWECPDQNPA
jgi:diguanylate cyclase (GGDEF)-like protein